MRKIHFLLLAMIFLLSACYPLSVTRKKWRIHWDRDMKKEKKHYLKTANRSGTERPPNIVILLVDDLGKYEVSAYGVDHISTPHIDQIGQEGVIFDEAYVTAPTCAPSRAGIMTGRVQNRYGFETQIMEFYPTNMIEYLSGKYLTNTGEFVMRAKPQFPAEWQIQKQGVPPTEINLAEALKPLGYVNGLVGKWHLGISRNHKPLKRGFDYQYGFYGAFSLYTPERDWSHVVNHEHQSFSAQHQWNMGRYGEAAVLERERQYTKKSTSHLLSVTRLYNSLKIIKRNPFSSIAPSLHHTFLFRPRLIIIASTVMWRMTTKGSIMP